MSALAATPLEVHCPTCHRRERWAGGSREVRLEGGLRRPDTSAERAAFDVLAGSLRGELGPVVGVCRCGLPLVAESDAPSSYVLDLGALGTLELAGHRLTRNGVEVALDAIEAEVHAAHPAGLPLDGTPIQRMMHGGALALLLFPMFCWLCAVAVVIIFYATWATGSGATVGPP